MKNNLVLIIISIIVVSCSTSQIVTNGTKASEIKELAVFHPITSISYIDKGSTGFYSQSLSDSLQKTLSISIDSKLKPIVQLKNLNFDSATVLKVEHELIKTLNTLEKSPFIDKVKISPFLDSVLVSQGADYAMCVVHTGFTRSSSNYAGKLAGGLLLGIATMGMVYTVPLIGSSMMYCFILDHKKGSVAFYRTSKMTDTNPVKYQQKQIEKIFKGYFNVSTTDNFYY